MEQSSFFYSKFACWEICMKYNFGFLEKLKGANITLSNCYSLQKRHFKYAVNWEHWGQKSHFPHCSKKVSDYLPLHAAVVRAFLWITGLRIFNMTTLLALFKINICFNSSHASLTQGTPLWLTCVSTCVHAAPVLPSSLVPVYISAPWKPPVKHDALGPAAGVVTLKRHVLSTELPSFKGKFPTPPDVPTTPTSRLYFI